MTVRSSRPAEGPASNDLAVEQIMRSFALRTGLTDSARPPVRYLWTDAFAVCNFLGRFVEHGDDEALRLAIRLIDQTHRVLGQHREDAERRGWISGLGAEEGKLHPTRGGLRIGKRLPERTANDRYDPELEWERDGQYFHYLTRWMHALVRTTEVTGNPTYRRWAYELVEAVHPRFTDSGRSGPATHLYWKMSIDLDRPQIASMGQHDPLDGLATYSEIQAAGDAALGLDLGPEIRDMASLCSGRSWQTDDALGIGGLLCDACRLVRWSAFGVVDEATLLRDLLHASERGLATLMQRRLFDLPPEHRLGFRELGLSIGLRAVPRIRQLLTRRESAFAPDAQRDESLERLGGFEPLAGAIEQFWLAASHRECSSWRAHLDINEVMLATSLAPEGYLGCAESR